MIYSQSQRQIQDFPKGGGGGGGVGCRGCRYFILGHFIAGHTMRRFADKIPVDKTPEL